MGIYSRTKSGHKDTANILRFEDKHDEEEVFIQAQKNMDIQVRNSKSERVSFDNKTSIGHDDSLVVANNRTVTVDGKQDLKTAGDVITLIGGDNHLTVEGDVIQQIDGGVGATVQGNLTLQSESQITLRVGSSFVVIHAGGVDIKGPEINLNTSGSPGEVVLPMSPLVLKAAAVTGSPFVSYCPYEKGDS